MFWFSNNQRLPPAHFMKGFKFWLRVYSKFELAAASCFVNTNVHNNM